MKWYFRIIAFAFAFMYGTLITSIFVPIGTGGGFYPSEDCDCITAPSNEATTDNVLKTNPAKSRNVCNLEFKTKVARKRATSFRKIIN